MATSILVIGDPHFKVDNAQLTDAMKDEIQAFLQNESVEYIIVLGDVLDRHEKISMNPLYKASSFFEMLCSFAPVYCLVGNHDRRNNSVYLSDEHSLTAFRGWQRLHIIDKPTEVLMGNDQVVLVPYVPLGRFNEALSTLLPEDKKEESDVEEFIMSKRIFFAHQEFKGVKMGHVQSDSPDVWKESYPMMMCGHIHDYSEVQPNLIYVGTPIQHGFNEAAKKTVSLVTLYRSRMDHKRLELHVPKKILLHLSVEELDSFVPDPKHIYKIIIEAKDTASVKMLPKLQALEKMGVKIQIRSTLVSEVPKIEYKQKKPFRQLLLESLETKQEAKRLFHELFS